MVPVVGTTGGSPFGGAVDGVVPGPAGPAGVFTRLRSAASSFSPGVVWSSPSGTAGNPAGAERKLRSATRDGERAAFAASDARFAASSVVDDRCSEVPRLLRSLRESLGLRIIILGTTNGADPRSGRALSGMGTSKPAPAPSSDAAGRSARTERSEAATLGLRLPAATCARNKRDASASANCTVRLDSRDSARCERSCADEAPTLRALPKCCSLTSRLPRPDSISSIVGMCDAHPS